MDQILLVLIGLSAVMYVGRLVWKSSQGECTCQCSDGCSSSCNRKE